MTRVATYANHHAALLDLMSAQVRGQEAQTRVSTQKVAQDLKGFGRGSETLIALKSMQNRVAGFIETGETVKARLETQALSLDRIADAAQGARQAIAEAIAAGRLEGLMMDIQSHFQSAQDGLNAKHQGRHLFAGARSDTAPVTADTLADLASFATVDAVFVNDDLKQNSRLDESATLQTNFLADELGTPLFEVFRAIQDWHAGPNGPIDGQLDDLTRDFLEQQLGAFDAAREGVIQAGARNGAMQNRVDTLLEAHQAQETALKGLVGERTDADMAQAITDLQLSQVAIQASAHVLSQLRDVSLLNLLAR